MAGEKTRFTKADAPAAPAAPEEALDVPDFRADAKGWMQSDERTKWWRDVLSHPYGLELAAIVRNHRPPRSVSSDGYFQQSAEETLGVINGFEAARVLLFVTLARGSQPVVQKIRPGQERVAPHPVTT